MAGIAHLNNENYYMTRNQIKKMILDLLGQADYDLMKSFLPETAEDPECSAKKLEELISMAEKHINKSNKIVKK